jgi:PAS domain S-box-containing protein
MAVSGGFDARAVARLLKSAASLAYAGGSPEERLGRVLDLVCAFTGWPLGHVYLVDRDTMLLEPSAIWHDEDPDRFASFVETTRRTPLPIGGGLPGRILASVEPAWIVDVRRDPNFPRAQAAIESGLAGAFGFPVVSALGIEGVMEFFAPQPMDLDDSLLDLMAHIGRELGHALDRDRVQAALAASEARLAEAERLGHMGAWLYHVQKDQLDWSVELLELYGLDPSATPTTFAEYLSRVYPDDLESVRAAIVEAIERSGRFEHEYRLLVRPDEVRWAHSRGEVVAREDGRSRRLAGFCQDVTERKLREEAIRAGQERLAEAQRIAHIGSWSWDVATNSVTWSDELFRIYGLEPGASPATFEAYLERVHAEDRDRVRSAVERTVETREPFEHDYRIVRPDGTERWVHARGQVTDHADRAGRFAGYCHDITERRAAEAERTRLESQLHQARRLESLGQLAGGVAHDFNNLLAVMLSYTAFVDEELHSLATSTQDPRMAALRADVEQIRRAASRAAELTRQLLAFGRREVVRPKVLRLDAVVRGVEQLLRRTIGEHVELETSLAADLWPVSADAGQLEQVLVNLAVNARDAMPRGGRLAIEAANVHIGPDEAAGWQGILSGRHVRLRVSDTGHGMPREVAERAFEPFFTTKATGEGSGLGLATVHGIVAQAGGGVRIDSSPGVGTTVTALLPVTDAEESAAAPERGAGSRPEVAGEGGTVLVVENDEAMRKVTRRHLERGGYDVIDAAGGVEAIGAVEVARSRGADLRLLVTDVVMPQMLGMELAARLTAALPDLRVVYMSSHAHPLLAPEGTLAPGVVLLEKPFTEEELLSRVRQVLEGTPDEGATGKG